MDKLFKKSCVPCEGGVLPFNREEVQKRLSEVPNWQFDDKQWQIFRVFQFKNFYQTMAFVNMLAWIAHQENHHPLLEVGYDQCTVKYWTHSIKGLSENDFICAAKIDLLFP